MNIFKKIALQYLFVLPVICVQAQTQIPGINPKYLEQPIDLKDVRKLFGIPGSWNITPDIVDAFYAGLNIWDFDATQNAMGPPTIAREAALNEELKSQGIQLTWVQLFKRGLATQQQYLSYLRVAYGAGRCPGIVAGSAGCPATLGDLEIALEINVNLIVNLRVYSFEDDQFNNKLAVHRESVAYRLIVSKLARLYSNPSKVLYDNPFSKIVLDPANNKNHCQLLESVFSDGGTMVAYLKKKVNMKSVPALAETIGHLYDGMSERADGVFYHYGIFAFLKGEVLSRDTGIYYTAENPVLNHILKRSPDFPVNNTSLTLATDPKDPQKHVPLNCVQIANMINVVSSFPYEKVPSMLFEDGYPYDNISPDLTGDDILEFITALGNALPNKPNAPFDDLIPKSDLKKLQMDRIDDAEFEAHNRLIRHFSEVLLGL